VGDKAFLARLERRTKRTLQPAKRGPKPHADDARQGTADLVHCHRNSHRNSKSSIFNMYPNLAFLVFPTRVRPSVLIPNGPDDCEWLLATFYSDGAATDPVWRNERDATLAASAAARTEDDRVCEAVQRARRSPVFRKRFYSPFWDNMVYSFNRRILDDLERG
jgi:Ring hydroxylating alpha subunit (catalytic domain)